MAQLTDPLPHQRATLATALHNCNEQFPPVGSSAAVKLSLGNGLYCSMPCNSATILLEASHKEPSSLLVLQGPLTHGWYAGLYSSCGALMPQAML